MQMDFSAIPVYLMMKERDCGAIMDKSEFHPSEIPAKPGVYVYRDRFGKVIYVGKAANLRRRMSSYFQPSRVVRADAKLRSLINSISDWSAPKTRR